MPSLHILFLCSLSSPLSPLLNATRDWRFGGALCIVGASIKFNLVGSSRMRGPRFGRRKPRGLVCMRRRGCSRGRDAKGCSSDVALNCAQTRPSVTRGHRRNRRNWPNARAFCSQRSKPRRGWSRDTADLNALPARRGRTKCCTSVARSPHARLFHAFFCAPKHDAAAPASLLAAAPGTDDRACARVPREPLPSKESVGGV